VLDPRRWSKLRPGLLDLPALVLCGATYLAATANDPGAYEGLVGGLLCARGELECLRGSPKAVQAEQSALQRTTGAL
jgi:hypothetical protein